jgi:hypothetical protein
MEDWPLSSAEKYNAKRLLYQNISFLDVARKYVQQIIPCQHKVFTHKCICPFHSEGTERTPSLCLSEKTKEFHCFACNTGGDVFDFLSLIEGRPWTDIVQSMLSSSTIDQDSIDEANLTLVKAQHDVKHELSLDLSIYLREYLFVLRGKPCYDKEKEWVDRTFKRIDDRFKTASPEELKCFRMQILIEINRRKG